MSLIGRILTAREQEIPPGAALPPAVLRVANCLRSLILFVAELVVGALLADESFLFFHHEPCPAGKMSVLQLLPNCEPRHASSSSPIPPDPSAIVESKAQIPQC